MTDSSTTALVDDFAQFNDGDGKDGPRWLRKTRAKAMARFERLGFPTPRNEDWHYTSVAAIAEAGFRVMATPGGEVTEEKLRPFLFGRPDWPLLVFVNGRYDAALSRVGALPPGVTVTDLATAAHDDEDALDGVLGTIADQNGEHAFTALNTAFMHDGAVVRFAKHAVADLPIHLVFVSDAAAVDSATHVRTLIVADEGSQGTVIESFVALGNAKYFTNAVSEVQVGANANVRHLKVQRESERAFHVGTTEVMQGRDSHYFHFSYAAGALLSRTNVYTVLNGAGCGTTLNGAYLLDGEQHCDHQTRVEHVEPNCYSRELYKGVLDGASHGVFNGKVYVHPEAQKTDGKQTNNTLVLSDRAHIDTKPQLEIFADDVKCTHGATVGRIDETAYFYMRSRGVNPEQARRLLTYAFAADALETIDLPEVRDALEALTLQRFTGEITAAMTGIGR